MTDRCECTRDAMETEIEALREALVALKDENEMLHEALKDADNEYQQHLLAATILMVKAAGGRLVITEALMAELALHSYGTMLHQERDPEGNITLTVNKPKNLTE